MTGKIEKKLRGFDEESCDTQKRYAERIEEKAEEEPEDMIEYVPMIEPYIDVCEPQIGTEPTDDLLSAVGNVAKEYPEEVLPLAPALKRRLDESVEKDGLDNAVGASFALGMVANEYPNVAENSIPRFVELTKLDNKYVSNNAMALLADLSAEYPDELVEYLRRCSAGLDSEDNYMRYNSLTLIARVAKECPDEVEDEVGVDRIERMLDADEAIPREKACWALMYLGERATESVSRLKKVSEEDGSERVRKVAKKAVYHIESEDKDWRVE
jgi:hypothetical protein